MLAQSSPPAVSWRSASYWVGILILNFVTILKFYECDYPIDDLNETIYHVRQIHLGLIPHRDFFSHHFVGYLLPLAGITALTGYDAKTIWLLGGIFNFASVILIFLTLREIATPWVARTGGIIAATLGWLPGWTGYWFNAQSYILPILYLHLWALIVACSRRSSRHLHFAALILGFLLCCDQRLAPFTLLLFIPAFDPQVRFGPRSLLPVLGLSLFCPLVGLIFLASQNALADFVQQTLVFPLVYRNAGLSDGMIGESANLLLYWLPLEGLPVVLACVSGILMIRGEHRRYLKVLSAGYVLLGLFYIIVGGRAFPHYLLILSPTILFGIPLLPWYVEKLSTRGSAVANGALILIALVSVVLPYVSLIRAGSIFIKLDDSRLYEITKVIEQTSAPLDEVLVWGYWPKLYTISGRMNSFRDVGLISVTGANYASDSPQEQGIVPAMVEEFKSYLKNRPPRLIVNYIHKFKGTSVLKLEDEGAVWVKTGAPQRNNDFRRLAHLKYFKDLIETDYQLCSTVDGELDRAEIYINHSAYKNGTTRCDPLHTDGKELLPDMR